MNIGLNPVMYYFLGIISFWDDPFEVRDKETEGLPYCFLNIIVSNVKFVFSCVGFGLCENLKDIVGKT